MELYGLKDEEFYNSINCINYPFLESYENISEAGSVITNIKKTGKWTQEEDEELKKLVQLFGKKNWKKISQTLINKSPVQCLHRWTKILKPGLTKGPWSIEEDRKLLEWVKIEGPTKWSQCAEFISGRSGKQCRERWFNTLHPEVKKGDWSAEEDYIIFNSFSKLGSKWSTMAKDLPGRTENSIKNRFYSTLRRIWTETKKSKTSVNKCKSMASVGTVCPPLNELLVYFQQALNEKRNGYIQYRESIGITEPLISNEHSNMPSQSDCEKIASPNQDKAIFLKKKVSRDKSKISTTNNSPVPKDTVDQSLIQGLKPKINKDSYESLGHAIINTNNKDVNMTDYLFENLETKINKIIEKDSHVKVEKKVDNNFSNGDYINLLSQLNELEKILQATKQEIYQNYENSLINSHLNNMNTKLFDCNKNNGLIESLELGRNLNCLNQSRINNITISQNSNGNENMNPSQPNLNFNFSGGLVLNLNSQNANIISNFMNESNTNEDFSPLTLDNMFKF